MARHFTFLNPPAVKSITVQVRMRNGPYYVSSVENGPR